VTFDPAAQGWTTWQSVGLTDLVGPFWMRQEAKGFAYGFVVEERHLNRGRITHGGMIATFLDIVMGRTAHDAIRPRSCATVQLNLHYVSASHAGEFIEARGETIKTTQTLVFSRGACTVGDRTVAMADGLWKILSPGRRLDGTSVDSSK
jgi:acyl-coenzyme A thioesterase PaaI-like protein